MRTLIALIAFAAVGCSGAGKLVSKKDQQPATPTASAATVDEVTTTEPAKEDEPAPRPKVPLEMALTFAKGDKATYILTNETTTQTRGLTDGPIVTTKSFLDAKQEVTVTPTGLVRIHTFDVRAGVHGDAPEQKEADKLVKQVAEAIEGSMLQGEFDAKGRSTDLFLLGEGIGLNPMGPQAGAQEVMVGFMGIVLADKKARPGDEWKSTYDITASATDLFPPGSTVDKGEVPITYRLIDYDEEKNYVRLGISSKGKPIVKVPMGGGVAEIQMSVTGVGEAILRLDSGWLQELRFESTIVTEGFVATKQVVRTVTRRQT